MPASPLTPALIADGPAADRAEKIRLYAFRWTAEVPADDGAGCRTKLEIFPRRLAQASRASS